MVPCKSSLRLKFPSRARLIRIVLPFDTHCTRLQRVMVMYVWSRPRHFDRLKLHSIILLNRVHLNEINSNIQRINFLNVTSTNSAHNNFCLDIFFHHPTVGRVKLNTNGRANPQAGFFWKPCRCWLLGFTQYIGATTGLIYITQLKAIHISLSIDWNQGFL